MIWVFQSTDMVPTHSPLELMTCEPLIDTSEAFTEPPSTLSGMFPSQTYGLRAIADGHTSFRALFDYSTSLLYVHWLDLIVA